jgi:arsenate reductase (thioredoxin)
MAEAFANRLGAGRVRAWSAGSAPLGRIIPETHDVLREKGISLEGHRSKGLADVPLSDMDAVVGMGCEVTCPVPVGFKGRIIDWDIPDPYDHDLDFFRRVRDMIERQVAALLKELHGSATPESQQAEEVP